MNTKSLVFGLLLMGFFNTLVTAKSQRFEVAYKVFNCSVNHEIVAKMKCEIKKKSQMLVTNATYRQDMSNVKVHTLLQVSRLNLARKELQKLMDVEVDLCYLFDTGGKGLVVRVLLEAIVKDLNVPKTCPFPKNTPIIMNNIDITENMPALMPEMDFYTYLKFYYPSQPSFHNVTIIGRLSYKQRKLF